MHLDVRGQVGLGRLSLREALVVRLLGEGRSDAEIAERLEIAVADVGNDLGGIVRKLGLRSRTELALLAPGALAPEAMRRSSGPRRAR